MDSKFNIAIIVLVVLSQLGGALIKAWRKRQSAPEGQRSGGGVVVVPQTRSGGSGDSWSGGSSAPAERSGSSWESSDAEESEEAYWEEHLPGELDESPAANSEHGRQHNATQVAAVIQHLAAAVPAVAPVQAEARSRHAVSRGLSHVAGTAAAVPRARAILGRTTLRGAILAQVVLAPPNGARRLRR